MAKGYAIRVYATADGRDLGFMCGRAVGLPTDAPLFFIHKKAADDLVRLNEDPRVRGEVEDMFVPDEEVQVCGFIEKNRYWATPDGLPEQYKETNH